MGLFRKKARVDDIMRAVLRAALQRDLAHNLREVAPSLKPVEAESLQIELPLFTVALWHVCFLYQASERNEPVPPDLGERFGSALMFATADVEPDLDRAETRATALLTGSEIYLGSLEGIADRNPSRDDVALAMSRLLVGRVAPGLNLADPADRERSFQILDIGRQEYGLAEAILADYSKTYRITY